MPLTEYDQYQLSLKYERDIKNVVDTARDEGIEQGIIKTAKKGLKEGASIEFLAKITGLSEDFIQTLKP